MEKENELIEQNLKCPICLNIVEDPWETSCCGHLFCEKCKSNCSDSHCPLCRNGKFKFRKNLFAGVLLSQLDTKCPYGCNQLIKFKRVKMHKYECAKSNFKCKIKDCFFEGNKAESLKHLLNSHGDLLSIVSENFALLKPIFEKFDIIEKNEFCDKNVRNFVFDKSPFQKIKSESCSENKKTN